MRVSYPVIIYFVSNVIQHELAQFWILFYFNTYCMYIVHVYVHCTCTYCIWPHVTLHTDLALT